MEKVTQLPNRSERYQKKVDACVDELDRSLVQISFKYDPFVVVAALLMVMGATLQNVRKRYGLNPALGCYQKIGRLMMKEE